MLEDDHVAWVQSEVVVILEELDGWVDGPLGGHDVPADAVLAGSTCRQLYKTFVHPYIRKNAKPAFFYENR